MRWLVLLLLLWAGGCAPRPQPVWEELPSSEQLLARLAQHSGRYQTLDAAAKVSLTLNERYFSSRQFLALQRPDLLRTDILSGFGQLLLQLATDGETLWVFRHDSVPGRFYRGPATRENLARFLRLPLRAEELLRLLLYDPPLQAFAQSRVELSDAGLRLILDSGRQRQILAFDRRLRLIGSRYLVAGDLQLEVEYADFSDQQEFPGAITLTLPAAAIRAKLILSDLSLNQPLPVERFKLAAPQGITVEQIPQDEDE